MTPCWCAASTASAICFAIASQELRFPTEPCEAVGIVGQGGQKHLDRDEAIQLRVAAL